MPDLAIAVESQLTTTIVVNAVAQGILSALIAAAILVRARWERIAAKWRINAIRVAIAIWALTSAVIAIASSSLVGALVLFSGLALSYLLYRELARFWHVGLVSADKSARDGLGYAEALELCRNSMAFLGIGASKLTACGSTFDAALKRCNRPNAPIRFILCHPDNAMLREFARQGGAPDAAYADKVRDSLRRISQIKQRSEFNIEVRFYEKVPLFRLMFADGRVCLSSHYAFGDGDGSHLPQLHVENVAMTGRRDVEGLYVGFNNHFEQIWQDSRPWEPQEFWKE